MAREAFFMPNSPARKLHILNKLFAGSFRINEAGYGKLENSRKAFEKVDKSPLPRADWMVIFLSVLAGVPRSDRRQILREEGIH